MFNMPDALAFCSVVIMGTTAGITALCKFRRNGRAPTPTPPVQIPGVALEKFVSEKLCDDRFAQLKEDVQEIKGYQERVFKRIDNIDRNLAALNGKGNKDATVEKHNHPSLTDEG